jgi:hypothetical protein
MQKTRRTDERPEQAFARFYSTPESFELRKAINVAKRFPSLLNLEPTMVGGKDATDVNGAPGAYNKLTEMAEAQRKLAPWMSAAQAFARVFEAPENAELAAKAHQRPSQATSYAFPR